MKPIKLKIKGLNSFIDVQEINFTELTNKGLFGIFGPTGSGKSTILDGITLALYGAVARGSSNYMNTNCETLNVSYEFQISEKEIKRYRVEREFRKDKKTGNVRSKSAKIVQLVDDNEMILEEQATNVTAKCEEIIGLKLEDFTRTVVLPQGKFSEFLRLEGKDKREMLERLFNLQKYGDELSSRLQIKIKQEKDNANILEGELKTYQDCSEEILLEKTKEQSVINEKLKIFQEELKKAEEDFIKGKQLWDLQIELRQQTLQKTELEKQELEVKENERKANLAESALKVKPYLESYENTLNQIEITKNELSDLGRSLEAIAVLKNNAEVRLEQTRYKKENELPNLKLREQNVAEAIEEKKKLDILLNEKSTLQNTIGTIEKDLEASLKTTEKSIRNINTMITDIEEKEKKVDSLIIGEDYKKKINEAIVVLSKYEAAEKQIQNLSKEIEIIQITIKTAQSKAEALSKELETKEEMLQSNNLSLQKLIEASPGDQDTLIAQQDKLSRLKDIWSKYNDYCSVIQRSRGFVDKLLKESEIAQSERNALDQEINSLEVELKKIENENIAHILRKALLEGEACPVCGSKHHDIEGLENLDTANIEQLKTVLSEKKDKYQKLSEEITKTLENIRFHETNQKEYQDKVNELGEEFKAFSVENIQAQFENLKAAITQYNLQKNDLEKIIKNLSEDNNTLGINLNTENTIKVQNESQLENRQRNYNLVLAEFEEAKKELEVFKSELDVDNFKSKREEIINKEKTKANLESELKKLRETLKSSQEQKEKLNSELASMREALKESNAILVEKDKTIDEKTNSIKMKAGEIKDLERVLKEILDSIKKIDQDYAQAENHKNAIEKQYNECNTRWVSAQNSLNVLYERSTKDKELLDKALLEEKFKDISEVKNNLLDKTEIDKLRKKINEYRDSLAKLTWALEDLKKKIDNRSLTEAQWIEIQNVKNQKAELLKELDESKIKLESNIKVIREKLVEKTKRLKIKEELDRKLGLLDDLEKLFKGKKFVEFVAANQLKYVSIDAGKKLKEITGGNYGLEVDVNGKFLIRDYKNGGAQRDASTLSGGETFLTSLSLALALSAQIQLKGTAPLELFFLDEGFGTLDDNLLEVVMDSLEKIHNERLSIGIISHVESIKNRVPIKLLVTPAKAGMGGSKVKLEIS